MALGRLLTLLAVIAMLAVAGCGGDDNGGGDGGGGTGTSSSSSDQPGKGKPAVTIGTKDLTEEFVLGNLYAQALQAKGYKVNLKENIGATEVTDKALTSGQIDAYPEYTGETTATVFGKNKLYKSAEETANEAKALYEKRGQVVSNPTPFEDVDAIATTKQFADKNGLSEVPDLKKLDSFTLGARPEFKSRFVGLKGMEEVYGIHNAEFTQLALGLQYKALDKGDVDSANVFSTDAQLASGKYTVLKDPKGVFGFQNILFVINKDKYDALGGTTFMDIINKVNALLTAEAMRSMNSAVDIDKQKPADVAKAFLQANGMA
jgi:osmoprotectant transport system substrate-binding protein